MKVYLLKEKKTAEFNDCYGLRLVEQGKAVPAVKEKEPEPKAEPSEAEEKTKSKSKGA